MPRLSEPHMATCHPDRRHYARDMCLPCYHRDMRRLERERRERIERRIREMEKGRAA